MNAAEQGIFEELFKSSQIQNELLKKLAGEFKRSEGLSSGGGGIGGFVTKLNLANVALNVVTGAFNLLSSIVSGLANAIGQIVGQIVNLVSNLYGLAKATADGSTTISGFLAAFKDVPILGTFFGLLSDIVAAQEKYLDTFQKISRVGANLTGNLSDITSAMNMTRLSLSELASVVENNADVFSAFGGGSSSAGYKAFLNASESLSRTNDSILALGVTAQEYNGYLTTTMRNQTSLSRNQFVTSDQLANYTKQYIVQLDEMTRLTGIQREELDKQVKKAQDDQLFQLFLDSLTPDDKQKVELGLAIAAPFGEGAVNEFKARMRGLDTPVSDFGTKLAVLSGGVSLDGTALRLAFRGTKEEFANAALNQQLSISRAVGGFASQIGFTAQAAGVAGEYFSTVTPYLQQARKLQTSGLTNAQMIEQASNAQAKAIQGGAGRFAKAELAMKMFGEQFLGAISDLLGPLVIPLSEFARSFLTILKDDILPAAKQIMPDLGEIFKTIVPDMITVIKKIVRYISDLLGAFKAGYDEHKSIWEGIKSVLSQLWFDLKNFWKEHGDEIKLFWTTNIQPIIVDLFRSLFSAMKEALGVTPLTDDEKKRRAAEYDAYIKEHPVIGPARGLFALGPSMALYGAGAAANYFGYKDFGGLVQRGAYNVMGAYDTSVPTQSAPTSNQVSNATTKPSKQAEQTTPDNTANTASKPAVQTPPLADWAAQDKEWAKQYTKFTGKDVLDAVNISNQLLALIADNTDNTHTAIKKLQPNLLHH
jgi:hypothetical protein